MSKGSQLTHQPSLTSPTPCLLGLWPGLPHYKGESFNPSTAAVRMRTPNCICKGMTLSSTLSVSPHNLILSDVALKKHPSLGEQQLCYQAGSCLSRTSTPCPLCKSHWCCSSRSSPWGQVLAHPPQTVLKNSSLGRRADDMLA